MNPDGSGSAEDPPDGITELELTPIGDAMASLLRSRGLGETVVLAEVLAVWEEVAGPEIAAKVRITGLRSRELLCEVEEPAWATQVKLMSEALLCRLCERVGAKVADRITVQVRRRSQR